MARQDGASGPRIVDSLVWYTDSRKSVRVGLPLPDTEHLHNALDWQLRHDARVFTLAEVRKMPACRDDRAPSSGGRFVWFETSANGFIVRSSP